MPGNASDNRMEELRDLLRSILLLLILSLLLGQSVFASSIEPEALASNSGKPVESRLRQSYNGAAKAYLQTFENRRYFYSSIPNESLTNRAVVFQLKDDLIFELIKDNKKMDYVSGQVLKQHGVYQLRVLSPLNFQQNVEEEVTEGDISSNLDSLSKLFSDATPKDEIQKELSLENKNAYQAYFNFRIITQAVNDLKFVKAPPGFLLQFVYLNNSMQERIGNDLFIIKEEGQYRVTMESQYKDKVLEEFTFRYDITPPQIVLEGLNSEDESEDMVLIKPTEENLTLKLFRNGNSEELTGRSVSKTGYYRLMASDEAGNIREYSFRIVSSKKNLLLLGFLLLLLILALSIVYMQQMRKKIDTR